MQSLMDDHSTREWITKQEATTRWGLVTKDDKLKAVRLIFYDQLALPSLTLSTAMDCSSEN